MAHFQRKLESYQRRLRSLEAQGISGLHTHRAPKQVLRDVGIGIKYANRPLDVLPLSSLDNRRTENGRLFTNDALTDLSSGQLSDKAYHIWSFVHQLGDVIR